jgi:hypothetical protein
MSLRTKFHRKAKAIQMFAQNYLGAPLRQAAPKIIATARISQVLARDFPQTGTQELKVPDAHASAKERLDQAAPVKHLQYRRLENGTTSLAMWREPALHDAA